MFIVANHCSKSLVLFSRIVIFGPHASMRPIRITTNRWNIHSQSSFFRISTYPSCVFEFNTESPLPPNVPWICCRASFKLLPNSIFVDSIVSCQVKSVLSISLVDSKHLTSSRQIDRWNYRSQWLARSTREFFLRRLVPKLAPESSLAENNFQRLRREIDGFLRSRRELHSWYRQ